MLYKWLEVLCVCLYASMVFAIPGNGQSGPKPNVIIILADDFGRECLHAYGGQSYTTPVLDYMANHGLLFRTCYATPLCAPSRNMLLSGCYNFRNYSDWNQMDPAIKTVAAYMKDAGYVTGLSGKWHRGGWDLSPKGPAHAGFMQYCSFDYYEHFKQIREGYPENCYWGTQLWENGKQIKLSETQSSCEYFSRFAIDFISRNKQHPFFLYYAPVLVHRPFVPVRDNALPHDTAFKNMLTSSRGNISNFPMMVSYLDELVGRVIRSLKSNHILDKTIILFASDNGTDNVAEAKSLFSGFKGKEVRGGKYFPTELGVNVPMFIYAPGYIKTKKVISMPVDFTDILPTCYELAGRSASGIKTDGHSFASLILHDSTYVPRNWVYSYGNFDNKSTKYKAPQKYPGGFYDVISNGHWKYYSNNRLFDVNKDILETKDIPPGYSRFSDSIRMELKHTLDSLRSTAPRLW